MYNQICPICHEVPLYSWILNTSYLLINEWGLDCLAYQLQGRRSPTAVCLEKTKAPIKTNYSQRDMQTRINVASRPLLTSIFSAHTLHPFSLCIYSPSVGCLYLLR